MSGLGVSLEFFAALLLIGVSGFRLSHYAALIAVRTGFGSTWIGFILLATVTSLPELITGVSAVGLVEEADIAVGAVLGSCVFNLLVLAILDYMPVRESVYGRLSRSHLVSAGFGVILIGLVGFDLVFSHTGRGFAFGHVGFSTPLIVLIYGIAVRTVYRRESSRDDTQHADTAVDGAKGDLRAVFWRFGAAAAVVVAAGLWLPFVGERMAVVLEMDETFVGTLFIAFATSVPELVVAVAAVRIGAPNMALGNLLGSNLFNILILVPDDLLFTRGPIFSAASSLHALSAVSAIVMTGIVMAALVVRPRGSRFGRASLVLLAIYLINSCLLYLYGE
jgi:cation:H+ antiporter